MQLLILLLMTMLAWHIKNWDDHENAETRKYVELVWFRNKVKLAGEGLGFTLSQRNGPHLYGMFKLIEQVAAGGRLQTRGWLLRNDSPMDARRIANLLRLKLAWVEEALKFFSTPPMDWIERVELPAGLLNGAGGQESAGRNAGESPGEPGVASGGQESAGRNAPTGDVPENVQRTHSVKKKERKKPASPEETERQKRQYAANQAIITDLEGIPEDERSPENTESLKNARAAVRAIRKKQAAGDFTPL